MNESKIRELIAREALFVVNHSGGKDSQTMLIKIRKLVPSEQILIIHAHLPEVEWANTWDHVKKYSSNLECHKVVARKTFLGMVERRGMFPSPSYRQCTSDLKRGPIEKFIRNWIKDHNLSGLVVNCMGLRAEESTARAKKKVFTFNVRNSKAGREWYDWLPVHGYKLNEVWTAIRETAQEPHWAYSKGMSRLSCCFCIMASKNDLKIASEINPELFKRICDIEKQIGHTMKMNKKEPIGLKEFINN